MEATMQEEPIEQELPPRPRRRLLGAGGNHVALALLCVLLTACGFIGGVLVEKGEAEGGSGSSSAAAGGAGGIASRLAALRGGGSGGGASRGAGVAGLLGAIGASSGGASGGSAPTVGQVAYVHGDTLYVTDSEGNTIKVEASAGTTVTRTARSSAHAVHPGETVIVAGSADGSGTIHAQSIRASEPGSGGGGLGAALFGGGGGGGASLFGGGASGSAGTHRSEGAAEGPALFGK